MSSSYYVRNVDRSALHDAERLIENHRDDEDEERFNDALDELVFFKENESIEIFSYNESFRFFNFYERVKRHFSFKWRNDFRFIFVRLLPIPFSKDEQEARLHFLPRLNIDESHVIVHPVDVEIICLKMVLIFSELENRNMDRFNLHEEQKITGAEFVNYVRLWRDLVIDAAANQNFLIIELI